LLDCSDLKDCSSNISHDFPHCSSTKSLHLSDCSDLKDCSSNMSHVLPYCSSSKPLDLPDCSSNMFLVFPHCSNFKPLDLPDCSSSKPLDLPLCSNGRPPDLPDRSINMSHVLSKPLQSSSLNCCTFLELSVNNISKENINTSLYQSKSVIRSSSSKLSNLLRDTSSQSNCLTSISKTICDLDFSVICKYKTMNSYFTSYHCITVNSSFKTN